MVGTFMAAQAVFQSMTCSSTQSNGAVGCLAGQLLAAKLNVANGASACIAQAIASADTALIALSYVGPGGNYRPTAQQRQQIISLKTILENYNKGLGCQ